MRGKRRSRTREVAAVEASRVTVPLRPDRGILFSNGGSSAAWRAINFSLAADYEGRTLLFIFPRQGPLVGEIQGGNGERNRTRLHNRLVDARTYFSHPPTNLYRI